MPKMDKQTEVRRIAQDLFKSQPDWAAFYREILGPNGIVRYMFRTPQALARFEQSEAYEEIQAMLAKLRKHETGEADSTEPTKVITVRLPKSLHEALRVEAFESHTSMNKLCISKLLQFIERERIPTDL